MTKPLLTIVILGLALIVSGCQSEDKNEIHKVGMIVEDTAQNNNWDEKGYQGIVRIKEELDVEILYQDSVQSEQEVIKAVDTMVNKGVNLIFGHSNIYGKYFINLASYYPDVHFIYFNGDYTADNVTSLNFNSHAMGFFAGMVAGKMTTTNSVGVIAAHEWQPEVEGFFEGAKYQNNNILVHINYVNDWNDTSLALEMYEGMKKKNVDVIYPTGDAYSDKVIRRASNEGIYSIGYVSDQSAIDRSNVLTSTIQHVDKLYLFIANLFQSGSLRGDKYTFDFQDDAISLGTYSEHIPDSFISKLEEDITTYKEMGLLPNEQ